jgi:hypothetical protein
VSSRITLCQDVNFRIDILHKIAVLGHYTFVGDSACIGEFACSYISSPNMTILDNACGNPSACRGASGAYTLHVMQ